MVRPVRRGVVVSMEMPRIVGILINRIMCEGAEKIEQTNIVLLCNLFPGIHV